MKFGAQRNIYHDGVALYACKFTTAGRMDVATNLVMSEMPEGSFTEPFLRLTNQEAQELANELYAAGIHPTQAAGSAGQLDATRKHLEDMRALVFKKAAP